MATSFATVVRHATVKRDNENVRFVTLQIADRVTRYHKVGDDVVLGDTNTIVVSYKYLLKTLGTFASDAAEAELTDAELESVLKGAVVDGTIDNFKAGDKYVDESNTESEHQHNGSDVEFTDFTLRRGALEKVLDARDKRADVSNKFAGVIAAYQAAGLDPTKLTINL